MAYDPRIDFLGLLRRSASGVEPERMPGLDFTVSALARAGLITLYVGQTAPLSNQSTTAWFKPAQPSWTAEGVLFLWDASAGVYAAATPALWGSLLAPSGYLFQGVTNANAIIAAGVTVLGIERAAPALTSLVLPSLAVQWRTGRAIKLVDWSTAVANHSIVLTTPDGSTIAQQASWQLLSTAAQLASAEFTPVPELNGWIVK